SVDPAAILPTTLFATACSTIAAILAAKVYQRFSAPGPADPAAAQAAEWVGEDVDAYPAWVSVLALAALAALIPVTIVWGRAISPWILPSLMLGFLLFGAVRRV